MKKTFSILALTLAMGVFAQDAETGSKGFAAGNIVMTGTVGFSQSEVGDAKTSTFTLAPSAAYFLTDNWSLGLSLGYGTTDEDPGDVSTTSLFVGPQVRYYFSPKNDFSLFLNLEAGYMSVDMDTPMGDAKMNGFAFVFNPAINYFVSEHFALQASIGQLSYASIKNDDTDVETKQFDLNVDLSAVNFGLLYKF